MEALKELFSGQALTYDQLAETVKAKGMQVVDATDGAYVPKTDMDGLQAQVTALTGQLNEANGKLAGFDPEWKSKADAAQQVLDKQLFEFALDKALSGAKARDIVAVKAHLDREKLTLAQGEMIGLDKQLDALRTGESTAFLFAQETPVKTGLSHQGAGEGGMDKKEEANAALRALARKGN